MLSIGLQLNPFSIRVVICLTQLLLFTTDSHPIGFSNNFKE